MTKAGDLVAVFVCLFIFTARMPLVTKVGDLDSVFVFGFVLILYIYTENPRGSIWTGLAREYL